MQLRNYSNPNFMKLLPLLAREETKAGGEFNSFIMRKKKLKQICRKGERS